MLCRSLGMIGAASCVTLKCLIIQGQWLLSIKADPEFIHICKMTHQISVQVPFHRLRNVAIVVDHILILGTSEDRMNPAFILLDSLPDHHHTLFCGVTSSSSCLSRRHARMSLQRHDDFISEKQSQPKHQSTLHVTLEEIHNAIHT